ncbi:MAG: GGDEF domain-containing protein [bacterium]|nr:GGDEF domain-containing protein [bacterium]
MQVKIIGKKFSYSSKLFFFGLGVIFTLINGFVIYMTRSELAFSMLYFVPIIMTTWLINKEAGYLIAIISIISWFAIDMVIIKEFKSPIVPYINGIFRSSLFLFMVFILSELKKNLDLQKELAGTDSLTGINNRRAFFILAEAEINRAVRFKNSFSVAYIDLDNFKSINDRFGHDTGDVLLRMVAGTIKHNIRSTDVFARLGGDEFIILFSEVSKSEIACVLAGRFQSSLKEIMKKNEWPVTLSVGIAVYKKVPASVDELIKESDSIMYFAKQSGKDKIKHKIIE